MRSRNNTIIALLLLSLVAAARSANWGPAASLIPQLPGYSGSLPSELYGGYQTVGGTKNLFYLLSVSQADPGSDPLVVWCAPLSFTAAQFLAEQPWLLLSPVSGQER